MTFLYVSLAEHENYRAPQASIPIEETYLLPVKTGREWTPPKKKRRTPYVEKRSGLLEDLVVLVVSDTRRPMTITEIATALGRADGAVQKSARWCVRDKRLVRSGVGTRRSPYLYRVAP